MVKMNSIMLSLKTAFIENKRQMIALVAAVFVIFKVHYDTTETFGYFGIADTKEINISSSSAVMIKKLHVIPGQKVSKGMLIVELERPEIELNIYDLKSQIDDLVAEANFNKEMNRNLKSIKVTANAEENNPVEMKINNLREQLKILEKERDDLFIFAQEDGIIGSVNVKVGEKISPFTPFVTIHKNSPTMIRGYIHEQIYNKTFENQKVIVSSIADSSKRVEGVVASVGSRIIEFPVRLLKNDSVQTWGREVVIIVPEDNPFLVGEKVYIESTDFQSLFLTANAAETKKKTTTEALHQLKIADKIKFKALEPSGIIYLKDIKKYLVISDDTGKKDPALVFLMNEKAEVETEVTIEGIDEISDMEAVTVDEEGYIYILASQSLKKDGGINEKRKQFLKIKRDQLSFKVVDRVVLYDLIENLVKISKSPIKEIMPITKNKLDIDFEGLVVKNDTAFIGLRNSQKNQKINIVRLNGLKSVFLSKKINQEQLTLQQTIDVPQNDKFKDEGISDITLIHGKLFITTVNNSGFSGGRVLITNLDEKIKTAKELKVFNELKPEGITYNDQTHEYVITFDQGDDVSKVMFTNKL
jgi:multidrug resistance efflux pump